MTFTLVEDKIQNNCIRLSGVNCLIPRFVIFLYLLICNFLFCLDDEEKNAVRQCCCWCICACLNLYCRVLLFGQLADLWLSYNWSEFRPSWIVDALFSFTTWSKWWISTEIFRRMSLDLRSIHHWLWPN